MTDTNDTNDTNGMNNMNDFAILEARLGLIGHTGGALTADRATTADTEAITGLLYRTALWLQSRGSTQWSGLLHGEDSHRTPEAIARGNVFVARDGAAIAGMLMLLRQPSAWDRELWGADDDAHAGAVYLHRLAIDRGYAGGGLGERLLRWADSGIRFAGRDRVRLDCIADNVALNGFYSRMGYAFVGTAANAVGVFSKFEKRLDRRP